MLITQSGFKMFIDYDLDETLRRFTSDIRKEIESDREALNMSEAEYVNKKINQYRIDQLNLFPDRVSVSQKEYPIPSQYFPSGYLVSRGKSYPKPVLTFRLPFNGNPQWLRYKPSTYLVWSDEVSISNNEIIFEIINFDNNVDLIKRERDDFLHKVQEQVSHINEDINKYNLSLEAVIKKSIEAAKNKFKDQDNLLSQLGNTSL